MGFGINHKKELLPFSYLSGGSYLGEMRKDCRGEATKLFLPMAYILDRQAQPGYTNFPFDRREKSITAICWK
jgi:hypothetical protein